MLSAWLLVVGGCSSPPPQLAPEPFDDPAAAVGLSFKLRTPVKITSRPIDVVFFARLEDGETIDDLSTTTMVYASTFHDGEHAYLLNVEPGRYVAIGAMYVMQSNAQVQAMLESQAQTQLDERRQAAFQARLHGRHTRGLHFDKKAAVRVTDSLVAGVVDRALMAKVAPVLNDPLLRVTTRVYFSRELIERSLTEVGPRSFTFMGRFVADEALTFGDRDSLQSHFFAVLEGDPNHSGLSRLLNGEASKSASPHEVTRDAATEREFLSKATRRCKSTGWMPLIEQRLATPPPR